MDVAVVAAVAESSTAEGCCPECAADRPWACWQFSDGPLACPPELLVGAPEEWLFLDGDDDEERAAWQA